MRILADENIDGPLVQWLRAAGHDVAWLAEVEPGLPDQDVVGRAATQGRIVLTQDRDIGELLFRGTVRAPGAVYLRLRARSAAQLLMRFQSVWPMCETRALGNFLVAGPTRIRVRPLPR